MTARLAPFLLQTLIEVAPVPQPTQAVDLSAMFQHLHQVLHAQGAAHARLEFGNLERLGDEIHRSKIQSAHTIHGVAHGTDEDHRDVLRLGVGLQVRQHLESIHRVQLDVEQDHLGHQFTRLLKALLGAQSTMQLQPLALQTNLQQTMDEFGVIDRKQARRWCLVGHAASVWQKRRGGMGTAEQQYKRIQMHATCSGPRVTAHVDASLERDGCLRDRWIAIATGGTLHLVCQPSEQRQIGCLERGLEVPHALWQFTQEHGHDGAHVRIVVKVAEQWCEFFGCFNDGSAPEIHGPHRESLTFGFHATFPRQNSGRMLIFRK